MSQRKSLLLRLFFMGLVAALGSGCIGDMFFEIQRVAGDYFLKRSDYDTYWLQRGNHWIERENQRANENVVNRKIRKIGWTKTHILVQREPFVGEWPPDWMLIDVNAHTKSGPFSWDEWKTLQAGRDELKPLLAEDVGDAWRELVKR